MAELGLECKLLDPNLPESMDPEQEGEKQILFLCFQVEFELSGLGEVGSAAAGWEDNLCPALHHLRI